MQFAAQRLQKKAASINIGAKAAVFIHDANKEKENAKVVMRAACSWRRRQVESTLIKRHYRSSLAHMHRTTSEGKGEVVVAAVVERLLGARANG